MQDLRGIGKEGRDIRGKRGEGGREGGWMREGMRERREYHATCIGNGRAGKRRAPERRQSEVPRGSETVSTAGPSGGTPPAAGGTVACGRRSSKGGYVQGHLPPADGAPAGSAGQIIAPNCEGRLKTHTSTDGEGESCGWRPTLGGWAATWADFSWVTWPSSHATTHNFSATRSRTQP